MTKIITFSTGKHFQGIKGIIPYYPQKRLLYEWKNIYGDGKIENAETEFGVIKNITHAGTFFFLDNIKRWSL